MEVKESIIINSDKLFHLYGIRSVSMDDIARELSISKKTIYQYFKDKDDLVLQVTKYHMEKERNEFQGLADDAVDPIDELVKISVCLRENFKGVNPSLVFDLKKYHRLAWNEFIEFKSTFLRKNIADNLINGKEKGFFRAEIDVDTLSIMRIEQVQMCFDENLFPSNKYELHEVQLQLFNHFVYGILTEKGRKLYKSYQEKLQQSSQINEP